MSEKKTCALSGSVAANPLLVMLLGAGPAMAATASVDGALFMGLAVLLVMLLSNLLAALLGKLIPCSAKLPAYAIIGAGVASLVQMLMQAFLPGAAQMLGVYLAVLAVDLLVFAGAEASKGCVKAAVLGSVKTAVFFTAVMVGTALVREVLGAGSIFGRGIPVLTDYNLPLLQNASGAFIVWGIAAAVVSKLGCCSATKGTACAAVGFESCCCENTEKEEA